MLLLINNTDVDGHNIYKDLRTDCDLVTGKNISIISNSYDKADRSSKEELKEVLKYATYLLGNGYKVIDMERNYIGEDGYIHKNKDNTSLKR